MRKFSLFPLILFLVIQIFSVFAFDELGSGIKMGDLDKNPMLSSIGLDQISTSGDQETGDQNKLVDQLVGNFLTGTKISQIGDIDTTISSEQGTGVNKFLRQTGVLLPETSEQNINTGNIVDSSTGNTSLANLEITEIFFHPITSWVEITNTENSAFSGKISLIGLDAPGKIFSYDIQIPEKGSLVLAQKDIFFTGNFLKQITNDTYHIDWEKGLNVVLEYGSGQESSFSVHSEWTQFLEGKDVSFEKVFIDGSWLTTRTSLDRRKNLTRNEEYPFIANPGLYFTEAENAKDISQPKNIVNPEPENSDFPILCDNFTDRYRLEIQEIFYGNEQYKPFIELKWTETAYKYSYLKLTGSLLEKEIFIEKNNDLWDKNKTFLIEKDESRYDNGIDSLSSPDFNLLNQTGYLVLEGRKGQSRQVLDIIFLTENTGKNSYYFGGNEKQCAKIFNENSDFSPGFDRKFLEFFQIESEPKIKYITVGGASSCSCPSKEDICSLPSEKKDEEISISDENSLNLSGYQIKIEDIVYNPPGNDKGNEKITLILTSGDVLDLKPLYLEINGRRKGIKGFLKNGESTTIVGNFGFPNSSKNGKSIVVQLKYKDFIFDSYYYTPSKKKTVKKQTEKKDGIRVFSVLDGDTLRYRNEEGKLQSVRLLGIDTPESNTARYRKTECYGKEAKEYLTKRIKGKYIDLTFEDGNSSDRYGRLLAYVRLDRNLINQELIEKGFAKEYTYKHNYSYQESFKEVEKQAQLQKIGMWNVSICPNMLEQEKETKENRDNLIIKITNIIYNPPGKDKGNEEIHLSLYDKTHKKYDIDFGNQFGLFVFDQVGSGSTLDFESFDLEKEKFIDLSEFGKQIFKSNIILKGDFKLPNTKSTCVALIQKEHIFDIACYDIDQKIKQKEPEEKNIPEEENNNLTGIDLSILSLLPNPVGKDKGKEKIELLFESKIENVQSINLASGFYLLINGKTKKQLSGQLEFGKSITLKGTFGLPNTSSCISIGNKNLIFDTFCYINPKEGKRYSTTNEVLTDFDLNELEMIKSVKLLKKGNKLCISYKNEIFSCRRIPKTKSKNKDTKDRKETSKIRESAFFTLETLLKTEYRPRYEQTKIKDYFALVRSMKSDLKKKKFSTKIGNKDFKWKDISGIYNYKNQRSVVFGSIEDLFITLFPEKIISLYEKKRQERILNLPDDI